MLDTLEYVTKFLFWLLLLVAGIGSINGWWVIEQRVFYGIVLIALSILIITCGRS